MCLTSDAWRNNNSDNIISYNSSTIEKDLFLESVETGVQGHDAEFLMKDIERVMGNIDNTEGFSKFVGYVSYNTSTYQKVWRDFNHKYPEKFAYGCAAHACHLIIKSIFSPTKRGQQTIDEFDTVVRYAYEELRLFTIEVIHLVHFFKNHYKMKSALEKLQSSSDPPKPHLAEIGETRWGTVQKAFQSVLDSENFIYSIVTARDFNNSVTLTEVQKIDRTRILNFVSRVNFKEMLVEGIEICKPIDELIVQFQSSRVPLSVVYDRFDRLSESYIGITNEQKRAYINGRIEHYWALCYGKAHAVAYLLDPRFIGERLSLYRFDNGDTYKDETESYIYDYPLKLENRTTIEIKLNLQKELDNYLEYAINSKISKSTPYMKLMRDANPISPYSWWTLYGIDKWPTLVRLAHKVFSLAPTSALAERSFSGMSFMYSKVRNSLHVEKVNTVKRQIIIQYASI